MRKSTQQRSFVTRYTWWIIRWRFVVFFVSLAFAATAIVGVKDLTLIASYKYHFGSDNPELAAHLHVENTYTENDNLLFVVAPKSGEIFNATTLQALSWLTDEAWQLPYSIRVDSVTNFQHTRSTEDDLIVENLVSEPGSLSESALGEIRNVALSEPQLVGNIVAATGDVTAVAVTMQLPDEGGEVVAVTKAREIIERFRTRYSNHDVALTGLVVLSAAFEETAKRDLSFLVPLMFLTLVVAMLVFLKSALGTTVTILIMVLSTASAMGIVGWLGIPINSISSSAPIVIMTIAIADSVHILVIFTQQLHNGLGKNEAIVESLRLNLQPVFLTTVTTIIGFLSLNSSVVPSLNDLGNATAIGVAAAWFFSMTSLPAFLAIVPYKIPKLGGNKGPTMERFAEWLIGNSRRVLIGSVAIAVIAMSLLPRLELNDLYVEYFDDSVEFRRDTDFTIERLTGIYQTYFSVNAGQSQGINEPGYLANIDKFARWLRDQPEVVHVSVLSDTMKRLNKNLHGDNESYYRLPEERELAAQYLLLYEMSLPYGLDLNNQVNVDKSATKITATIGNVSAKELLAVEERAESWLRAEMPPFMHAEGAGASNMFAKLSFHSVNSMVRGTLIAFALISAILIISFRSIRLGLLSLIPNILPTVIAFGIWAVLVRDVGMSVATVIAASLGIIVDATVHFLSKYLRARREQGATPEDAVRYALTTVGSALLITFLILVVGFAVLAFSSFKLNAHFGLLVAITIASALLAVFLLLPALLIWVDSKQYANRPT